VRDRECPALYRRARRKSLEHEQAKWNRLVSILISLLDDAEDGFIEVGVGIEARGEVEILHKLPVPRLLVAKRAIGTKGRPPRS
jgi:hypothetical protein